MSLPVQIAWGVEAIASVSLAVAAVNGQTVIHSNGLHVSRLV